MRILCIVALIFMLGVCIDGKKIFCYYSSFAQTRHGIGRFLPEDIDPHLCTHIIYAFVDITPDGRDLMPFSRSDQGSSGLYTRTLALKEKNPALKILLAVGGWQIGSKPFLPIMRSEENRKLWAHNVVKYLRKHKFDGFDVDWEFPATRGSPPQDKYRFTKLLKELYEAFYHESMETGKEKLLLTLATASGTYYIDKSYEPHKIIKYLDYMLLMTYNYHGQWEKKTGHHSGLYRHPNDPKTGEKSQLFQQWSIDYWLNVGIPKSKLIVGIPTYGMSFTLAKPSQHGVHAPVVGGGKWGVYTRETGILASYEICRNLQDRGWQSVWIEEQAAPYAYGGDQWVGYEDQKSIALKAKNILSRDLAGAFVWSIEMDDFRGVCGKGKYPLISTVYHYLGNGPHNREVIKHSSISQKPASAVSKQAKSPVNKYKSLSKIKQAAQNLGEKRFKKLRQFHVWKKLQSAAAALSTTASNPLKTQSPATTKSPMGDKNDRFFVQWWGGKANRRKAASWRPWPRSLSKPHRHLLKRPKNSWRANMGKRKPTTASPNTKGPRKLTISRAHNIHNAHFHNAKTWRSRMSPAKRFGWKPHGHNTSTTVSPLAHHHKKTLTTAAQRLKQPHETVTPAIAAGASSQGNLCRHMGVGTFPAPHSCEHFVVCLPGDWRNYAPQIMACPDGTRFDNNLKICNYASQVDCSR